MLMVYVKCCLKLQLYNYIANNYYNYYRQKQIIIIITITYLLTTIASQR